MSLPITTLVSESEHFTFMSNCCRIRVKKREKPKTLPTTPAAKPSLYATELYMQVTKRELLPFQPFNPSRIRVITNIGCIRHSVI